MCTCLRILWPILSDKTWFLGWTNISPYRRIRCLCLKSLPERTDCWILRVCRFSTASQFLSDFYWVHCDLQEMIRGREIEKMPAWNTGVKYPNVGWSKHPRNCGKWWRLQGSLTKTMKASCWLIVAPWVTINKHLVSKTKNRMSVQTTLISSNANTKKRKIW